MASLDIWIEKWNEWTLVHLHGDLVISTLPQFRSTLDALLERKNARIGLDLGELVNLDSSAIGAITRFAEEAVGRHREFSLFNPRRETAEVLSMVQFDNQVRVFSTREKFERAMLDRSAE